MAKNVTILHVVPYSGFITSITSIFEALGKQVSNIVMPQTGIMDLVVQNPERVVENGKITFTLKPLLRHDFVTTDVFILDDYAAAAPNAIDEVNALKALRPDAQFVMVYYHHGIK